MTDAVLTPHSPKRPALPEPKRERWQPMRLGLVELFHYDSEEFWFRDGHLLLRGNNGTGKSKVLSLTMPFLFDAQLRPSRIEPDGDNGKKMAWNLLMNGYQRRIGYTWIEFGRRTADGTARYLTLGAGLSAVAGRPKVDSWFFLLEGAEQGSDPRIGQNLWLTNDQRVVLTRERLSEAIEGRGQVFESAQSYRRAVDERLFHLGTKRYEALMDTLVQLRQPQLSKKPDEAGLSHALTEALPPMPQELLADVAEALNQLEEDRRQLEEARQLAQAVGRFDQRYRVYAGMLTRRQARELRQAQSAFDKASEEHNRTQAELAQAQSSEADALTAHEAAKLKWSNARVRHETLQADPTNQDANRLSSAEKDAERRHEDATKNEKQRNEARDRLQREERNSRQVSQRAEASMRDLMTARAEGAAEAESAGTAAAFGENPIAILAPAELAGLPEPRVAAASTALRDAVAVRREQLRVLQKRHTEVATAQSALGLLQSAQRDRQRELEDAAGRRAEADLTAEQAGSDLLDAWTQHCDDLVQLRSDYSVPLQELTDWIAKPEGTSPLHAALNEAYRQAVARHAGQQSLLDALRKILEQERETLEAEREKLAAGYDTTPLPSVTRDPRVREGRPGAPFWRSVDFQPHVEAAQRSGLEAALEASGLLDAWITPNGTLLGASGTLLLDSQWVSRPPADGTSLAKWLRPSVSEDSSVSPMVIEVLLASVACGLDEEDSAEAWVAPDGRYQLGPLAGAWSKPAAVFIGHTARAQARQRRLDEIAHRLQALDAEDGALSERVSELDTVRQQTEREWSAAPSDLPLREAVLGAVAAEREVLASRLRLDQADAQCRTAESNLQSAREVLQRDAVDMRLPEDLDALPPIADALERFNETQHQLVRTAREWRSAWPETIQQQARETEAREALTEREEGLVASLLEAEEAKARYAVLKESIGAQVETLLAQLAEASAAARSAEEDVERKRKLLVTAGESRAIAGAHAEAAESVLSERTTARGHAVERLQRFAESSLMTSALPDLPLPDGSGAWTIDPALTLARRAEQALTHIQDDDASWTRIQRQLSEDLVELQRSLSALGHQAPAEPNDWGLVVHIIYQNRPERPDRLAAHLADDIVQRTELLSAKEREVLENHLQAEIASEVQRLMRAANKQVNAINDELHKRPTSTGVRFRLQWHARSADDGGPVGLDIARERLLNTSSDLWSPEDRRVVGTMLQQQIATERARAEADIGSLGSSLIDQLASALDYRRWHQFRVQRLQDGQWRKLSGPASSGERALGLTVPLFAAISSFYGQGASRLAPRLMLLDEAFAGIDDPARAHCMGLIREFDLDFVITSEREWACYAELPGVSICQLQRREGVEAVFVSRWNWDGRAKWREDDPDRRFPSA